MTRKWGTIGAVITAVMLAARAIGANDEARDPERYKVIVDRAPFCASAAGPGMVLPNFATRFILVGVVSSTGDNGLLAIIQDKEQNNRIYFKAEGDMIDNVKVVKIEQSPSSLVLRQGLEDAKLSYQARAGAAQPGPAGMAQQVPAAAPAVVAPAAAPGAVLPVRTQPARRIPFRRGGNE
jgi:hypothetical protein